MILKGRIAERLKDIFQDIAERYEFEMDSMGVMEDHIHVFLSSPSRYCPCSDCANHEEHFGEDDIPRVSPGEGAIVGRGALE